MLLACFFIIEITDFITVFYKNQYSYIKMYILTRDRLCFIIVVMKIFYKRPLAFCLAVFLGFCLIFFYISPVIKLIVFTLSLAAFILLMFKGRHLDRLTGVLLALVISSSLSFIYFDLIVYDEINLNMNKGRAEAIVDEITYQEDHTVFFNGRILKLEGKNVEYKCNVGSFVLPEEIKEGDVIRCELTFSEFPEDNYGFNEKTYYRARGIWINADIETEDGFEIIGHKDNRATEFFNNVRTYCTALFDRYTDSDTAALLSALTVGDKAELDDSVRRDFTRCGVSHMLAISGMHLAVFMGCISLFAGFLKIRKRVISLIVIFFCLFFIFITGASASVLRASIMFIIMALGDFVKRDKDSLTSLFTAVSLIVVISPSSVFDVGLILSFTSTLGIIIVVGSVMRRLKSETKPLKRFLSSIMLSIITTLSALSFSLLPMVLCFDTFSLAGVVSNLILNPLITAILFCIPVFFILSPIHLMCLAVGAVLDILVDPFLYLISVISSVSGITVSLNYPFVYYTLIAYGVGFVTAFIFRKKIYFLMSYLLWILCFTLSVLIYNGSYNQEADVLFSSQGGNDAFIIRKGADTLYIDFGKGSSTSAKRSFYMLSRELYSCELDAWVVSKYSDRHKTTLYNYTKLQHIDYIYLPVPRDETESVIAEETESSCLENGAKVLYYEYGREFCINGVKVEISAPEYIKDSSVPVQSGEIEYSGEDIAYYGKGYFEIGDSLYDAMDIVIGEAGSGKRQSVSPELECERLIITDYNETAGKNVDSDKRILLDDEKPYIKMRIGQKN